MSKFFVSLFLISEVVSLVTSVQMTKVSEENNTYSNSTIKTEKRSSDPINDIDMIVANEPMQHPIYPYIFISPPEFNMVIPGLPLEPPEFEAQGDSPINDYPISDFPDMLLSAGGFEGDIFFFSMADVPQFFDPEMEVVPIARNAIINPDKLWQNGEVPYIISSSYGGEDRNVIARAMNQFHLLTCLKFVPRLRHTNYIHIHKGSGCSSAVGMDTQRPGPQSVTLGHGCLYVGIVIHELMHAIGFWHEQSRPDRDGYIRINWQNIKPGFEYNFKKLSNSDVQDLDVTYDPESIMHYGPRSFARHPGLLTIEPISNGVEIGQRRGFSEKDLLKVNALYSCHLQPGSGGTTGGTGGTGGNGGNSCVDDYDPYLCNYWAEKGECNLNPQFMQMSCKKSCGTCNKVVEVCRDENVHCGTWSAMGECSKNSGYMLSYCKKSCSACHMNSKRDVTAAEEIASNVTSSGETLLCEDYNDQCALWSQKDHCHSNPAYMMVFCRKSCGRCSG